MSLTFSSISHMCKRLLIGLVLSIQSVVSVNAYCTETLRVRVDTTLNQIFIRDALKLALSKLDRAYELQDVRVAGVLSEPRHVRLVDKGLFDIFWQTTTVKLEQQLQPIRIPIFRGLMGYRILVIPKNTQTKFDGIYHLSEFRDLRFGQSMHWPDTEILRANGLKVEVSPHFLKLYPMLKIGRFDALPRGLHQAWYELPWAESYVSEESDTGEKKVVFEIEKRLLLKYINPMYFFVSKKKPEFAKDIEKGMRLAINDGSYQRLFLSNPTIKAAILKSDIKNRTIIHLYNPLLPPETPISEKALWFDPEKEALK